MSTRDNVSDSYHGGFFTYLFMLDKDLAKSKLQHFPPTGTYEYEILKISLKMKHFESQSD